MRRHTQQRFAEEAARFMAEGSEDEYLHAKERAMMMLGLSEQTRLPSNKKIRGWVRRITEDEIGPDEVSRRVKEMREIALAIMSIVEICDPFLIGSTLSGEIRLTSDIDLHAYSDNFEEIKDLLEEWGYEGIEAELVENRKGSFVHLKWIEQNYPIEITIYRWSDRDLVQMSSVTGRPMKRADIFVVRNLLRP
jgi:predicted nucleotidyltransferase